LHKAKGSNSCERPAGGALSPRHLACIGQLRHVEKAPLDHAPDAMDRTDSDRAGLPLASSSAATAARKAARCFWSIDAASESNRSISSVERLSGMFGWLRCGRIMIDAMRAGAARALNLSVI
jgi:hypothetical protein